MNLPQLLIPNPSQPLTPLLPRVPSRSFPLLGHQSRSQSAPLARWVVRMSPLVPGDRPTCVACSVSSRAATPVAFPPPSQGATPAAFPPPSQGVTPAAFPPPSLPEWQTNKRARLTWNQTEERLRYISFRSLAFLGMGTGNKD